MHPSTFVPVARRRISSCSNRTLGQSVRRSLNVEFSTPLRNEIKTDIENTIHQNSSHLIFLQPIYSSRNKRLGAIHSQKAADLI